MRFVGARPAGTVPSLTYQHPLAFLLSLEGVALPRAQAGDGFDRAFVEARLAEIQTLLDLRNTVCAGAGVEGGRARRSTATANGR
jgi:hypothetical protein